MRLGFWIIGLLGCTGDPDKGGSNPTLTGDSATTPDSTPPTESEPPDDTAPPADADGDGYVSPEDCDDTNPAISPAATEACDGLDQDCDGLTDEDAPDAASWYPDEDGDGVGVEPATVSCTPPAGTASTVGDCDDTDPAVYPGAPEADCLDPKDYNCDGGSAYADLDGDGVAACEDCDDGDAAIQPGATERCNGADDDCDGDIDEEALDPGTWYVDGDGDGYGDPAETTSSCDLPAGASASGGDCDDADPAVHPSADESDCTVLVDLNCDGLPAGEDLDADGTAACLDCDDGDSAINPDATELCDGLDNDCDGTVDDAASLPSWYADADDDGYGDSTRVRLACDAPTGFVSASDDCDDSDAAVYPGADEQDCSDPTDYNCDGSAGLTDSDGDSWAACQDCDDQQPTVSPDGVERCDGQDEDCDGEIDEEATNRTSWFEDADGDRYGNSASTLLECSLPEGYSAFSGDCDDTDAAVSPAGTETCDGRDEDCDGDVDLSGGVAPTGASPWFEDADGDGFGDPASEADRCEGSPGLVATGEDCDDSSDLSYPGATERCDGVDEDCDEVVDNDAIDPSDWYVDADGDGVGAGVAVAACDAPTGSVSKTGDCDDGDDRYYPGAPEDDCADPNDYNCDGSSGLVDGDGDGFAACEDCDDGEAAINRDAVEACDPETVDEDCSGAADDDDPDTDPVSLSSWHEDSDGDGYGDAADVTLLCHAPDGYVADNTDCDDTSSRWHPGASEPDCTDPSDYDCDGAVEYADDDGDGFAACEDCDDGDPATHPDADERCDGIDNNCDGDTDGNDALDPSVWYRDDDGDGVGTGAERPACDVPDGYVGIDGDCDDADATRSPSETEVCNGQDDDCDGLVDPATSTDATLWYDDADNDGFGDLGASTVACDAPAGTVTDNQDCDDNEASVSPAAIERCDIDNVDEDCNGLSDDDDAGRDPASEAQYYRDSDTDGYGDATQVQNVCDAPAGYVLSNEDCDDTDPARSPGATEVCDLNRSDEDCDGLADDGDPGVSAASFSAWYADDDGDGSGDPTARVNACLAPGGYVAGASDCDDDEAAVHPGATEVCDSSDTDEDCSGLADDEDPYVDTAGRMAVWPDNDSDGYGATESQVERCDLPDGYVLVAGDCDDDGASTYPGATEICDPADADEDCDGVSDDDDSSADSGTWSSWYLDVDTDGYGAAGDELSACDAPAGRVSSSTDCDDDANGVNPGAQELCDLADVDEDCDGAADDDDPTVSAASRSAWYADVDEDGFGDLGTSLSRCDQPGGYLGDASDCDDTDELINPVAAEICDPADVDEDCDGVVDDGDSGLQLDTRSSWYPDADDDDYGDAAGVTPACSAPAGYLALDGDCDDTDPAVNPDAQEVCDAADTDEDCDGLVDDDDDSVSEASQIAAYGDLDGDGFGNSAVGGLTCDGGGGSATNDDDCDDNDENVHPGATEVCSDGVDQGCDGTDDCALTGAYDDLAADLEFAGVSAGGAGFFGGSGAFADLDRDGIADLVLGDGRFDTSTATAAQNLGKIYVLRGGAAGITDTPTAPYAQLSGPVAGDRFGQQIAGVPDLDSDGDDELLVGAYLDNSGSTDSGSVYLLTGDLTASTSLTSAMWRVRLTGGTGSTTTNPEQLGWAVAWVGDVNDDGVEDWAAGGYNYGGAGRLGRVSVASGDLAAGSYDAASLQLEFVAIGATTNTRIGASIADAVDFDGDGVDDLLSLGADATGVGTVYAFEGPVSGQVHSSTASYTITGLAIDLVNTSTKEINPNPAIANAHDNNGDGYADLILGSDGADRTGAANSGAAYLLLGPGGTFTGVTSYGFRMTGVSAGDLCGRSVAGPGDVDGDGFDDLLIGMPAYDSPSNAGAVALVYGPSSGDATLLTTGVVRWEGTATNANLGAMVAGGGDVNDDGFPDLLLGAPASTVGSVALGRARVVYGQGQ